jgi:hypothetical protein
MTKIRIIAAFSVLINYPRLLTPSLRLTTTQSNWDKNQRKEIPPLNLSLSSPREQNAPSPKRPRIWGGASSNTDRNLSGSRESLKDQAQRHAPALEEFVRRSNGGERLDGFCMELDDPRARDGGPEELGDCVRIMLTALADIDPSLVLQKESSTTAHSTNMMTLDPVDGDSVFVTLTFLSRRLPPATLQH